MTVEDRPAAQRRLARIIEQYFPKAPGQEDASRIMLAHAIGGTWDGWSPAKEDERLDAMRRHLEAAQRLWREMHPVAQLHIRQAAHAHNPGALALLDWEQFSRMVVPEARRALSGGREPGRALMLNVALVGECRRIWGKRTGKSAPRSASSRGFANFVRDVFNALGIEHDERSAINAWVRLYARA